MSYAHWRTNRNLARRDHARSFPFPSPELARSTCRGFSNAKFENSKRCDWMRDSVRIRQVTTLVAWSIHRRAVDFAHQWKARAREVGKKETKTYVRCSDLAHAAHIGSTSRILEQICRLRVILVGNGNLEDLWWTALADIDTRPDKPINSLFRSSSCARRRRRWRRRFSVEISATCNYNCYDGGPASTWHVRRLSLQVQTASECNTARFLPVIIISQGLECLPEIWRRGARGQERTVYPVHTEGQARRSEMPEESGCAELPEYRGDRLLREEKRSAHDESQLPTAERCLTPRVERASSRRTMRDHLAGRRVTKNRRGGRSNTGNR